jgi:hypothetical protein
MHIWIFSFEISLSKDWAMDGRSLAQQKKSLLGTYTTIVFDFRLHENLVWKANNPTVSNETAPSWPSSWPSLHAQFRHFCCPGAAASTHTISPRADALGHSTHKFSCATTWISKSSEGGAYFKKGERPVNRKTVNLAWKKSAKCWNAPNARSKKRWRE